MSTDIHASVPTSGEAMAPTGEATRAGAESEPSLLGLPLSDHPVEYHRMADAGIYTEETRSSSWKGC